MDSFGFGKDNPGSGEEDRLGSETHIVGEPSIQEIVKAAFKHWGSANRERGGKF